MTEKTVSKLSPVELWWIVIKMYECTCEEAALMYCDNRIQQTGLRLDYNMPLLILEHEC